jgi:hypothetical protein
MGIKVEFDIDIVVKKIKKRLKKPQIAVAVQVLKDSDYFCPDAEGTMRKSGKISKDKKRVYWDELYARRQYYEDNNKSKDKNPNASMKWFEKAKAEHKEDWVKLANDKYSQ